MPPITGEIGLIAALATFCAVSELGSRKALRTSWCAGIDATEASWALRVFFKAVPLGTDVEPVTAAWPLRRLFVSPITQASAGLVSIKAFIAGV